MFHRRVRLAKESHTTGSTPTEGMGSKLAESARTLRDPTQTSSTQVLLESARERLDHMPDVYF